MTTLHLIASCAHRRHTRAGHNLRAEFWARFAAELARIEASS